VILLAIACLSLSGAIGFGIGGPQTWFRLQQCGHYGDYPERSFSIADTDEKQLSLRFIDYEFAGNPTKDYDKLPDLAGPWALMRRSVARPP
jgi:hypothetical protein